MPLPDLFKQIREHFKTHPLEVDSIDCGTIITRDKTHFLSADPERWREKYERQRRQGTRGLFARDYVPYRALGDNLTHNGLDAEEMVCKTLKLPAKKTTYQYANIGKNGQKKKTFVKMPGLIPIVKKYEETEDMPTSVHGGLSTIDLVLKQCNERIKAQKKGVWYEEAAEAVKKVKTAAIRPAERESVIPLNMRRKSLFPVPLEKEDDLMEQVTKHWRDYRRVAILPPSLEDKLVTGASLVEQFTKDKSPPLQIQFRPDGSVIPMEEIIRCNEIKARNDQIAKLECVYQVLCCLHNLKISNLRSPDILSPSTLKLISQEPLKKEPALRPLTRIVSLAPVCSCISHTTSTMAAPGHVTWAKNSFVRPYSDGCSQSTMKKAMAPSIEMWRDVVEGTDGDSSSDLTSSAASQLKQYPLYKMLNNNAGATAIFGGQQVQFTARQIQLMPVWQKVLYFRDLYEDAASLEEHRKKSISEVIESCIKSFQTSRNTMAKTVRDEIDCMKKNSRDILTSKWKSLQFKPINGDAIVRMRLKAYQMLCKCKRNYDTKPSWFIKLQVETTSICRDNEDQERDDLLFKIQQLSHFDDRTVQYVEQKLFLLVLSMPAFELCTKSMTQAMCFVMKNVLQLEPSALDEWIQYRKLPNLFADECE
ncbi:uncharacterized protein [Dysidea avara]|uniref:uncharacterized protein n=1 Tax=Dysidea avara TaxID=196820 RepID=UPI00332CFF84